MSTARGSEPRGGPQTPGEPGSFDSGSFEPGPFDPALDHLISALTTAGHPHELAGRDTALAAFRAASRPRRHAARRAPRRREFPPLLLPARLAALVAAGVTVTAGLTAAAYAQALPAPVQEIAHTVLAPLGVPDNRPSASPAPSRTAPGTRGVSPSGSSANSATSGGSSATSGGSPSATAAGYAVTLSIARVQLPTGAFAEFSGTVNQHGHAAAGVTVRLFERAQGTSGWHLAASHATGPLGHVRFSLLPPTAAEVFVLRVPGGAHSAPITVTVKQPLTFWLVAGKNTDRLHVAAPFSKSGSTVYLMEKVKGTWTTVASKALGPGHRAVFGLPASTAGGHDYRVELAASGLTSDSLWIPVDHSGAKAITTSPSPTGTPSPSPTATPSPTASPAPTAAPTPPGASSPPTTSSSPIASSPPSTSSPTTTPPSTPASPSPS